MKKFYLSITVLFVIGTFAVAGGNVAPSVSVLELPVVTNEPEPFYIGLGYTYVSGIEETVYDVDAHAVMGLIGYRFNEYAAIEGRYTSTVSDVTFDNAIVSEKRNNNITNKAIYLKPMYPMGSVSVYALLGYGEIVARETSDSSFQWGLGTEYAIDDNFGFFVDYTRLYDDSGFGDFVISDFKFDTVNVGLSYRFSSSGGNLP